MLLKWTRNPDAAFLNLLLKMDRKLQQRGITLVICGVQSDLSRALAVTGLDGRFGQHRIFCERSNNGRSTHDAVNYAYDLLDGSLCIACPHRQGTTRGGEHLDYMI
jgi:hypothetical protein